MDYGIKGQRVFFRCPGCNASLNSPLEEAGQKFPCPDCGAEIETPGRKELSQPKNGKIDATEQEIKQRAGLLGGPVSTSVFALAVILLTLLIYFGIVRPLNIRVTELEHSIQSQLVEINTGIDRANSKTPVTDPNVAEVRTALAKTNDLIATLNQAVQSSDTATKSLAVEVSKIRAELTGVRAEIEIASKNLDKLIDVDSPIDAIGTDPPVDDTRPRASDRMRERSQGGAGTR
jgi:hypothetical protein